MRVLSFSLGSLLLSSFLNSKCNKRNENREFAQRARVGEQSVVERKCTYSLFLKTQIDTLSLDVIVCFLWIVLCHDGMHSPCHGLERGTVLVAALPTVLDQLGDLWQAAGWNLRSNARQHLLLQLRHELFAFEELLLSYHLP